MWSAERTVVATKVSLHNVSFVPLTASKTLDLPKESGEDNGSNTASVKGTTAAKRAPPVVTPAYSYGNKGREPEEHGEELYRTNSELMRELWEASWCESQVCYGQQCPNGREQHEVHAVG